MKFAVVRDAWRPHPLAWIHRAEARSIAFELHQAGHQVRLVPFRRAALARGNADAMLLRLSDPVMDRAVQSLTRAGLPYIGPSAAVMMRCYDKFEALRVAQGAGIDCPDTALGNSAEAIGFPLVVKPRRGSDSIGLKLLKKGSLPARARNGNYIVQRQVRGVELTVAAFGTCIGMPLRILLPEGTPYSLWRKYLLRPRRSVLSASAFAERVRGAAKKIAEVLGVDWAARIDLIYETATDRLYLLECDAAPLIGAQSAFAASFHAGGIGRARQLEMLLQPTPTA